MLKELRHQVLEANLELPQLGLVIYTWGNVSAIDREAGIIAIKPSGVDYRVMTVDDIVLVNLDGEVVWGSRRPSSDTPTHLALYSEFPSAGGVVHTHSTWATIWAQSDMSIPCLGTTHADYFHGIVPCTRPLLPDEIAGDYEAATGRLIVETCRGLEVQGALVSGHGPFTWGHDSSEAVHNAAVLEEVAKMAFHTLLLAPGHRPISPELMDKHFRRKHGPDAYYGQNYGNKQP